MNETFTFNVYINRLPRQIKIIIPVDSGFAITNQFRPDIFPKPVLAFQMHAGESISDFQADCQYIIEASKNSPKEGVDSLPFGLIQILKAHIQRCGRLILGDLMIYVDCFAHIMKAVGVPENEVKQCYAIELAIMVRGFLPNIKDDLSLKPIKGTNVYYNLMEYVNKLSLELNGCLFINVDEI